MKRLVLSAVLLVLTACEGIVSGEELLPVVQTPVDPQTFRALNWVAPLEQESLPAAAIAGTGLVVHLDTATLAASRLELATRSGDSLIALRKSVTFENGSQVWSGEFEGHPGSVFVLSSRGSVTAGFAMVGTRNFEIETTSDGLTRMYEVNEELLPRQDNCEAHGDLAEGTAAEAPMAAETASGQVVDLLVAYTQDTVSSFGVDGIESKIVSAVALANQAYQNSQVPITLRLVHMVQVNYTESGDAGADLTAVASPTDGKMDEVPELRNLYGADVVSLITVNGGGYCGMGYGLSAAYAYNVVAAGCFSNQTLTHEIGHNMGSDHNREDSGSSSSTAYHYGYRRCVSDGTGFRTVMGYPCTGAPRLTYFSNPRLSYNGFPLGVDFSVDPANAADNARRITETSATVASFKRGAATSAPAAPSALSATAASDTRINLAWSDGSSDESSFQIERSEDGASWAQIASVGENVTSFADTGLSASTLYWYRVRAINNIGPSDYTAPASATTRAPPAAPPTAPDSLVASSPAAGSVSLSWADRSADEDGFEIGRQKLAKNGTWGNLQVIGKAVRDATSHTDAVNGGTYRYYVRAFNLGGPSAWSSPAQLSVVGLPKGRK